MLIVVVCVDGHDPKAVLDACSKPQDLEAPGPGVDLVVQGPPLGATTALEFTELNLEEL